MNKVLVTGSSGLIGSEVAEYFSQRGWEVHGVDNNQRAEFFGPAGDTLLPRHRSTVTTKPFGQPNPS